MKPLSNTANSTRSKHLTMNIRFCRMSPVAADSNECHAKRSRITWRRFYLGIRNLADNGKDVHNLVELTLSLEVTRRLWHLRQGPAQHRPGCMPLCFKTYREYRHSTLLEIYALGRTSHGQITDGCHVLLLSNPRR